MAITPYDQASWSQYTPLTGQEILQPALLQRERHDKIDEEYAAINDMSQQIAFIAENETDPRVKQRYQNYMNQLQGGMETLMDRGVTPNSRREMLNLRSKFQSDLAPLKQGYEMKLQDMNIYNQMMMKDPTWRGPNPANRSVMDYVDNGLQPFAQTGVSMDHLYNQAAEMAKPYSKILNSDNPRQALINQFGAEYYVFEQGLQNNIPEQEKAMAFITEKIMAANSQAFDWARGKNGMIDPNLAQEAYNNIGRAVTQTFGEDKMVRSGLWDHKSKESLQIEAEKRAEERAANEAAAKNELPPIGSTRIPGEFVKNNNMSKAFKEYHSRNSNNVMEALKAKTYEDYKKSLNDKGEKMSGDTNINSANFDAVKAAYDIRESWESKSQEERLKEMQSMYPEADREELMEYASKGFAGIVGLSALAGKMGWLASSGVASTAGAGALAGAATAGALTLPVLMAGLFTSGQDIKSVNQRRIMETLEAMENPVNSQAVSSLKIPSIDERDYSEEDRLRMMEQDYEKRGVLANDAYIFDNTITEGREAQEALNFVTDLRTSGGTITIVNENNKREVIKARDINKKLGKEALESVTKLTEKDYVGHTAVNENFDYNPAYKFTKTIGDKTYYIEVPANTLKEDYSAFKQVFETINRGISEETYVHTPKGNYIVAPFIDNGQIDYAIMDGNGDVFTLEDFLESARGSVSGRYINKGQTRTEYFRQ